MLSAIALILAFQVVGEVISRSAGIPVPGPVIGMILMLLAFFVKDDLIGRIRPTGGVLLSNLSLLFVPAGVGIINYANVIWENAAAFVTICVVSTVLTYGATAWAVHLTCRLMEKKGEREK